MDRSAARHGSWASRETLDGDLVVWGAGDLDFQVENAMMIADALNRMGIRHVTGKLVVDRTFWMGWEGGSDHVQADPVQRGLIMAGRLRQGLDSTRWTPSARRAWYRVAAERGLDASHPPRVRVDGPLSVEESPGGGTLLLVHQSNPLVDILRKFDCFSNNDIERLDATAGPPDALVPWLTQRLEAPSDELRLSTSSGLGTNRISPRRVVGILREFYRTSESMGQGIESVLPVAGCEGCTITKAFPRLAYGPLAGAVAAKTGTLTATDGGIAVLAGFARTPRGEIIFCVAAPHSGRYLAQARRAEEEWVVNLIRNNGGGLARSCGRPLMSPVADARITSVVRAEAAVPAGSSASR